MAAFVIRHNFLKYEACITGYGVNSSLGSNPPTFTLADVISNWNKPAATERSNNPLRDLAVWLHVGLITQQNNHFWDQQARGGALLKGPLYLINRFYCMKILLQ